MRILIFILLFPFIASAQFSGLANNQAVSNTNLNNAVTNGYFTGLTTIPTTGLEVTKARAITYISGFNQSYPPFAAKASNQLIVKSDLYNPGNYILDAAYGMSFTSMSGSVGGLPTFTYPVTGGNTTTTYNGIISAQTLTIGLAGVLVSSPAKIVLYVDGVTVDCQNITTGVQTKTLTIPSQITSPSTIKISINLSSCTVIPVTPVLSGQSIAKVTMNKSTGKYMLVASGSSSVKGYLFRSNNYGSSWIQILSPYGYWKSIAVSGDGKYMLAAQYNGSVYQSTDSGSTFNTISSLGTNTFTGIAVSSTGQYQTVVAQETSGGAYYLKRSSDYGATWANPTSVTTSYTDPYGGGTTEYTSQNMYGVTMDSTGRYQAVGTLKDIVNSNTYPTYFSSSDYGATWTYSTWNQGFAKDYNVGAIKYSPDASKFVAAIYNSGNPPIYSALLNVSNSAVNYDRWLDIAINNSTTVYGIFNYNTANGSQTATQRIQYTTYTGSIPSYLTSAGTGNWTSIEVSSSGQYILAGSTTGLLLSTNSGTSFTTVP